MKVRPLKFFDVDVETIGSRFGTIHAALPRPALPFHATTLQWADLRALVQPATASSWYR